MFLQVFGFRGLFNDSPSSSKGSQQPELSHICFSIGQLLRIQDDMVRRYDIDKVIQ